MITVCYKPMYATPIPKPPPLSERRGQITVCLVGWWLVGWLVGRDLKTVVDEEFWGYYRRKGVVS